MKYLSKLISTLVLFATMSVAQAVPSFSAMYVFGDSLSDNGNISTVTLGLIPSSPPNFDGRFSNGPTWVEILGFDIGSYAVPVATSFLGGTENGINFAFGGATSGTVNVGLNGFLPGLQQELDSFSDFFPGNTADPDALYVVWAGANDYLSAIDLNPISVVDNVTNVVNGLYNKGARNFLVPNLPNLGSIPRNVGGPYEGAYEFLSLFHNSYLAYEISQLETMFNDIKIADLQVDVGFEYIGQNGAAFGISDIDSACLVGGAVCANPNSHLFWDDIHPTVVAHFFLSELAKISLTEHFDALPIGATSAVPVPAALFVFAPALGILLCGARRRS